jgi:hypothetical protein
MDRENMKVTDYGIKDELAEEAERIHNHIMFRLNKLSKSIDKIDANIKEYEVKKIKVVH